MSQITDNARVLSSVQTAQLFTVNRDAALIRIFSEKCLAESRFAARNRSGHTDNISRLCRKGNVFKYIFTIRIRKCKLLYR